MTSLKIICLAVGISLLFRGPALSQTPNTGSISGRVLSEDGHSVHATVTLSFAAARGYPAPPRRVTTTNSAFSFTKLPAGSYVLCAQVAPSGFAPANSPYVDTCIWRTGQTPVTLTPGQQATGILITAPKGTWLQVRVTDPDHVLPQASAKAHSIQLEHGQMELQ